MLRLDATSWLRVAVWIRAARVAGPKVPTTPETIRVEGRLVRGVEGTYPPGKPGPCIETRDGDLGAGIFFWPAKLTASRGDRPLHHATNTENVPLSQGSNYPTGYPIGIL